MTTTHEPKSFEQKPQEIKDFESKLVELKQLKASIKEEANKEISKMLGSINELFNKCEELAKSVDIDFRYDGPSYGMGGYFNGTEWSSSSQSC